MEQRIYNCPTCGYNIRKSFASPDAYACPECGSYFDVLVEPHSGRAAFFARKAPDVPEPLYLPRGSIRALVTLATAGSAWALLLLGRPVPEAVFSLLLTVIGFYFGFRSRSDSPDDRVYDATVRQTQPLFLPGGWIRTILILGFLVSGIIVYRQGRLAELPYLDFFIILFGLIVGHLIGRLFGRRRSSSLSILFNHAKGALVLAAAGLLCVLLLTGQYTALPGKVVAILAATISFYYGSRS